jgi:hypothetical protein
MMGSQHEMVDFMDLMVIYGYMVYRYNLMDLRHGYYSLNAGLNGYKLFGLVLFGTMVLAPNSGYYVRTSWRFFQTHQCSKTEGMHGSHQHS